eukprot:196530-Chlamydomonas_euryale.AAC.1
MSAVGGGWEDCRWCCLKRQVCSTHRYIAWGAFCKQYLLCLACSCWGRVAAGGWHILWARTPSCTKRLVVWLTYDPSWKEVVTRCVASVVVCGLGSAHRAPGREGAQGGGGGHTAQCRGLEGSRPLIAQGV